MNQLSDLMCLRFHSTFRFFFVFYALSLNLTSKREKIEKLIDTLTFIRFDKHVQTIQFLKCFYYESRLKMKRSRLKVLEEKRSQCPNNLFN